MLAGVSAGKLHWPPAPPRPFAALCEEAPKPLRIKLVLRSNIGDVDPEVAAVVRRAARALEKLGHIVEEKEPPAGSVEEFLPIWAHAIAEIPLIRWSKVQPITRWAVARLLEVERGPATYQ